VTLVSDAAGLPTTAGNGGAFEARISADVFVGERVVGLTAAFEVAGRFSDAVTLVLGAVPAGNGRMAMAGLGERDGGAG
jgi:hypothetical protein